LTNKIKNGKIKKIQGFGGVSRQRQGFCFGAFFCLTEKGERMNFFDIKAV